MKNKILARFLLPLMLAGAFSMPMTAYAFTDETAENTEITESAVPVEDEVPMEVEESVASNAFTVDGQATVTDVATDADGKEFYTFTTPAGNVFFLIIDHEKETDNVYFLNAVTEYDLMQIAESSDDLTIPTTTDTESAIPAETETPATTDPDDADGEDADTEDPEDEVSEKSNSSIIFIILAAAVFGVAAYYFKILKPKRNATAEDDYADEEIEDDPEESDDEDASDDYDDESGDDYSDYDDEDEYVYDEIQ